MSTDRPTRTPDQLTVDEATLVTDRATLGRLAVDSHVTIETVRTQDLVRLLRNTIEGRGYRLVTNTLPPGSVDDALAGTLTAEATREDAIILRERFVPEPIRLLAGLLAVTAGGIALILAVVDFAIIALALAGFASVSPYADTRTPATVTYQVQLEFSVTSQPVDTPADPSFPSDSRFAGRPTPSAVTVGIVSYAPFEDLPESGLREDVDAVIKALRGFSDV